MEARIDPYLPPDADLGTGFVGVTPTNEVVAIREAHLNHEASIKAIGSIQYFSSAVMGILVLIGLVISLEGEKDIGGFIALAILALMTYAFYWLGRGIRNLDRRVRVPMGLVCAIGLLGFPIGTLVNGYFLYLFFGEKGKLVMSEEYQRIIEQTPHLAYQTPMLVKVFAAILLLSVLAGAASFVMI